MKTALLAGLLCLFLPLKAIAQEPPDVNRLILEVVEKAIRNDEIKRRHLQFTKQEITRNLGKIGYDGKGKIEEDKIERRGVGLKNDESKLKPQDISARNHEFRYIMPYIQTDNEGRRYYQVGFRPKSPHQNGANPYIKGVNRCRGIMYIDADNLYVIRLEAEMPESEGFTVGGILGSIKWFNVEIKQELRPDLNDLVVITSVITKLKYRYVIPNYYEQYEYIYSDYSYIP